MEGKDFIESLKADLTCPICLGYFTDPVTAKCGHSFCRECLLQCREEPDARFTCPECRGLIEDSNLRPNKILQSLVTTGKMLRPHLLQSMGDLIICEKHGEREKLFCEEEQRALCESCALAPEHKDHLILTLVNAADKYRDELQETRTILQKKEEQLKISLDQVRRNKVYCKEDADAHKQSIRQEYEKMYQFLQNEENRHLQLLDQESRDYLVELEENDSKLSQGMQNVQRRLLEVEEHLEKAPLKMPQNMKSFLERKEEMPLPGPEIASPSWSTCPITGLREVLMTFHRDITLDPKRADPHLSLSEDLKGVEYRSVPEDLPAKEERLDDPFAVLGAQTFMSGKHYWEVELGGKGDWEVGVWEDSDSTNLDTFKSPWNITALEILKSANDCFIWKLNSLFRISGHIYKLGIFLDYENGHIAFYNATEEALLYNPPVTNFHGPLHPYFSLFTFEEETASLVICPRKD